MNVIEPRETTEFNRRNSRAIQTIHAEKLLLSSYSSQGTNLEPQEYPNASVIIPAFAIRAASNNTQSDWEIESPSPFRTEEVFSCLESELRRLGALVPDQGKVFDYLSQTDLAEVIEPICSITRDKFGDGAQLSLEMFEDFEEDDRYLMLVVRKYDYDDSVMRTIESIWSEIDERLQGKSGWLLVTTDYTAPR